jgi:hypothetical protein
MPSRVEFNLLTDGNPVANNGCCQKKQADENELEKSESVNVFGRQNSSICKSTGEGQEG